MVNPRFPRANFIKLTQASLQFRPGLPKDKGSLRQTRFNRLGCKSKNFAVKRSGEPAGSPFIPRLGEVPKSGARATGKGHAGHADEFNRSGHGGLNKDQ
jgi:hypothetical protein